MKKEDSCPWCRIESSMNRVFAARSVRKPAFIATPAVRTTPAVPAAAPAKKPTQHTSTRRRPRHSFWISGIGTVLSYILALIIWVAFNIFAQWGLSILIPPNVWWSWLLHFVLVGIVPFLPTWLFYYWGESTLPFDFAASCIGEILIGYGKWLALIGYGGVALVSYWGSGLINTLFGVFFFCLPILLVMKFLPSFAGE